MPDELQTLRQRCAELKLDNRDAAMDLVEARIVMRRMQQHIDRLIQDKWDIAVKLTAANDALIRVEELVTRPDGYAHDHRIGDGHDQCPGCWAEDIRTALKGDDDDV